MARKAESLLKHENLQEEVIFCKHYLLTGNKYESYIFAKRGLVPDNEQSVRTLSTRYFKLPQVRRIMAQVESDYLRKVTKDLQQRGYKVFTATEVVNGKFKKYLDACNNTSDLATVDHTIIDNNDLSDDDVNEILNHNDDDLDGGTDGKKSNQTENKLDKPIDKNKLRRKLNQMLNTAMDTELQLKIIKQIADLDNMKRDEVTEEKKVILFYLPYKECTECPNRKLFIKNNNS